MQWTFAFGTKVGQIISAWARPGCWASTAAATLAVLSRIPERPGWGERFVGEAAVEGRRPVNVVVGRIVGERAVARTWTPKSSGARCGSPTTCLRRRSSRQGGAARLLSFAGGRWRVESPATRDRQGGLERGHSCRSQGTSGTSQFDSGCSLYGRLYGRLGPAWIRRVKSSGPTTPIKIGTVNGVIANGGSFGSAPGGRRGRKARFHRRTKCAAKYYS